MKTIILSSVVADINGHVEFKVDSSKSEIFSRERRVSKRATLDGGSVIEDYGFTHTDRPFTIVARLSESKLRTLNYMIETFSSVIMSTVDGLYLGAFQDSRVKGMEVTIKILIKEKLA
jgi:hypothetical protein